MGAYLEGLLSGSEFHKVSPGRGNRFSITAADDSEECRQRFSDIVGEAIAKADAEGFEIQPHHSTRGPHRQWDHAVIRVKGGPSARREAATPPFGAPPAFDSGAFAPTAFNTSQEIASARRRSLPAAVLASTGTVEPPPLVESASGSAGGSGAAAAQGASIAEGAGNTLVSATTASGARDVASPGETASVTIALRVAQDPIGTTNLARQVLRVVSDKIAEIKQERHNDDEHRELLNFLEKLAHDLSELVNLLDSATSQTVKEPMFLGKAGEITHQLNLGFMEALEKNRARVFEIGVPVAVALFLNWMGVLNVEKALSTIFGRAK